MDSKSLAAEADGNGGGSIIAKLEASSIDRVVAGQAVTDLASAVKELVDNALDADSRTIKIRLFNQGIEIIEVSDDGCGVPQSSRHLMATQHATSKIRSFDDIYRDGDDTSTLGFRGEALFSLANLSQSLVVATRTAAEPLAQRLEYRQDGQLDESKTCSVPRKIGTTVAVVKLFHWLPVRRADLSKTIKTQRDKLMKMMQGYAILCLGVQFNLIDMVGSGASCNENLRLATSASSKSIEETVSSVHGSRFLAGLCRISVDLSSAVNQNAKVEGLVSKSGPSKGGAYDWQYFSINGRPVELPRVSRILGETWRSIEGVKKRPACVLCFTLPKTMFDVNLSPNKREVMLTNEDEICHLIQVAVRQLWEQQSEGQFRANEVETQHDRPMEVVMDNEDEGASMRDPAGGRTRAKRRYAFVHDLRNARMQHECNDDSTKAERDDDLEKLTNESNVLAEPEIRDHSDSLERAKLAIAKRDIQQEVLTRTYTQQPLRFEVAVKSPSDAERLGWSGIQSKFKSSRHDEDAEKQGLTISSAPVTPTDDAGRLSVDDHCMADDSEQTAAPKQPFSLQLFAFQSLDNPKSQEIREKRKRETADITPQSEIPVTFSKVPLNSSTPVLMDLSEDSKADFSPPVVFDAFTGTDDLVLAARLARLDMRCKRRKLRDARVSPSPDCRAGVAAFDEQINATRRTDTAMINLAKDDFSDMAVLGQFNLGFILVRCKNNHLWILDQHACDEKYNFERLCTSTIIQEQRLIAPLPLDLSPSEESCILDNIKIFEANGFRLQYDATKPPRRRFALTAIPQSGAPDGQKSVEFGKDDISAMCAMLSAGDSPGVYNGEGGGTGADGSGKYSNNAVQRYAGVAAANGGTNNADKVIARLPKAIAMLANRACRGSIMIGTALSNREMEKVVRRLQDVNHPWNCPHGRPTMRHVRDMQPVLVEDERRAAEYIAGPTVTILSQDDGAAHGI